MKELSGNCFYDENRCCLVACAHVCLIGVSVYYEPERRYFGKSMMEFDDLNQKTILSAVADYKKMLRDP